MFVGPAVEAANVGFGYSPRGSKLGQRGLVVKQPIIGVHLLTEFTFCSRAGLCTRETTTDEEPEPPANLNFLPDLDEQEIRQAIHQRGIRGLGFAFASLISAALALALRQYAVSGWPWLAFLMAATCLVGCLHACLDAAILARRLWTARRAKPGEPNLSGPEEQPVEWWSLRKAGYEPIKLQGNLIDETIGVSGKPWRVLRRGNHRIPVFRRDDDGPVRFQHRVRIAAYCHLLRISEGAEAPFGILLNRETRSGIAILISPESALKILLPELERARRVIVDSEKGKKPLRPKPGLCRGCPHGKPVAVSADGEQTFNSRGVPLPILARRAYDGRQFHCHCGDRFEDIPPHEKAVSLGLTT